MRFFKAYLFISAFLFCERSLAQESKMDSLKSILLTSKEDTNQVNTLNEIARGYITSDPKRTIEYGNRALSLATKNNFEKGIVNAHKWIAWGYIFISDYHNGLKYALNAISILEKRGNQKDKTSLYRLIGSVYFFHGQLTPNLKDFYQSRDYQIQSIQIDKKFKNWKGVASASGNLSQTFIQIARLTHDLKDYNEAISYSQESYKLFRSLALVDELPNAQANLADAYLAKGKFSKTDSLLNLALELYNQSLAGKDNVYQGPAITQCLNGIGEVYLQLKEFNRSIPFFLKALDMSGPTGVSELVKQSCEGLSIAYLNNKDFENAYKYAAMFKLYSDSLANENNTKVVSNYESEIAEERKEMENRAKEILHQGEMKQQRTVIYAISAGLVLVLLLSILIFRSYKQKQRSNTLLAEKNRLIEEKQKEIIDSIKYARRIQSSLLPREKYIDRILEQLRR